MNKVKTKKITKQIICIIIALMLCNFIIPTYSIAVSTGDGGSALNIISVILCNIPDAVIEYLQHMFVSAEDIKAEEGGYQILYSPGIIFSGDVPAFDLNFVNPGDNKVKEKLTTTLLGMDQDKDKCVEKSISKLMKELGYEISEEENNSSGTYKTALEEIKSYLDDKNNWSDYEYLEGIQIENDTYDLYYSSNAYTARGNWHFEKQNSEDMDNPDGWVSEDYCEYNGDICNQDDVYELIKLYIQSTYGEISDEYQENSQNIKYQLQQLVDGLEYGDAKQITLQNGDRQVEVYAGRGGEQVNNYDKYHIYLKGEKILGEYKSTAGILQTIISTWYNALRKIALVGLLSVLVYIGIKILLTSTSAKEKAKYKNMLKDWLVALCILFTLHYIMNITITIVNSINSVVKASSIGANGEDIMMSNVRNRIASGETWGEVIAYVVIYDVLVVYTVIYTIQYVRRVIHIGFLTAIAPLITLTYPLDKIKDGKSQAFDMWLKDYIFYSLIQVVHLLLYYIFLGSAINLNQQGNWLFAIVAIGFLVPAEKLIKKMFGFEKSKSMGAMTAGATGALVSNAMTSIAKGIKKGGPGKATAQGGTSEGGNSIRTVTSDPLIALRKNEITNGGQIQENQPINTGNNGTGGTQTTSSMGGKSTGSKKTGTGKGNSNSSTSGGSNSSHSTGRSSSSAGKNKGNTSKLDKVRDIKNGVKAVTKRYFKSMVQVTTEIAGMSAGALLGLAGGVAQGSAQKAFAGMVAGGTSGKLIAKGVSDFVTSTGSNVKQTVEEIQDTWNKGALGEEKAERIRYRRSDDYAELKKNNPNFSDDKLDQILDAGIKDKNRIGKILKNNNADPEKYNMEEAIRFSEMAKKCPETILYEPTKFVRYCKDRNILLKDEDFEEIRKNVLRFK